MSTRAVDNRGPHLPPIEPPASVDDRRLCGELRHVTTRRQIALVRSVSDELEHCLSDWPGHGAVVAMRAQLIEEVARLGRMALEAADSASNIDESGEYAKR
jgi:hypothetical protein